MVRITILKGVVLVFILLNNFQSLECKAQAKKEVRDLLTYIDSDSFIQPVKTLYQWQIRRMQILDSLKAILGPLPNNNAHYPADINLKDSVVTNAYIRFNVEFRVAETEKVTAYLYKPINLRHKVVKYPAIIACHPTGKLGKKIVDGQGPHHNRAYASELAKRGYVVIAPDYPGYGDQSNYDFEADPYLSGTMKAIFDGIKCVDFIQNLRYVDPERIGIIGHSLGGHTAMFIAAFEPRIKVVVSSCGWTLNGYYNNHNEELNKRYGSKMWGWAKDVYFPLVRTKYDLDWRKMPFDFDEIIGAIAPRPFFSNSPINDANFNVEGVRIGIANASRIYHFLNADSNLQVYYPVSSHNFPPLIRFKAYEFIDKYLKDNLTEVN